MVDLIKFCDPSGARTGGILKAPWSFGDFSYAVNGHIAIKVARRDDVPEYPDASEALKVIAIIDGEPDHPFIPLPSYTMEKMTPVRCSICRGYGHVAKCDDCNGEGIHKCASDRCSHEHACPECDGHGEVPASKKDDDASPCGECIGSGFKKDESIINFGGEVGIKAKYLAMIKDLAGFEIAIPDKRDDKAIAYRFDGGNGCVLPCRTSNTSSSEMIIDADRAKILETV